MLSNFCLHFQATTSQIELILNQFAMLREKYYISNLLASVSFEFIKLFINGLFPI